MNMDFGTLKRPAIAGIAAGGAALCFLLILPEWGGFLSPTLDMDYFVGVVLGLGLGTVLTIGLPVTLYLSHEVRAPFAVLILYVGFWMSLGGGPPGWFFAVTFWPVPVAGYLVTAYLERWWMRRGDQSSEESRAS